MRDWRAVMGECGNAQSGRANVQKHRAERLETVQKYRIEKAFSFVVKEISKIDDFQK
jgi:hypothetical protein